MALSRGFVSDLCPGDTTLDYAEREMKEEKKKKKKGKSKFGTNGFYSNIRRVCYIGETCQKTKYKEGDP